MKKILRWLDQQGEAAVIGILVAGMSILMGIQVVLRYCFHNSLSWVEEVIVYFHVWCGFIGLSYCVRHNSDMRIDISGIIPKPVAKALRWISDIILMAFYLYMGLTGITVVQNLMASGQKSPASHIPMFVVYGSFMVGCFLALFRFVQKVVLLVLDHKKRKENAE